MKFKYYFAIILIVTILFSLTCAAASENITNNIPSLDNSMTDHVISHSKDIINNPSSNSESEDNVDLSISVDFENVQKGNESCAKQS